MLNTQWGQSATGKQQWVTVSLCVCSVVGWLIVYQFGINLYPVDNTVRPKRRSCWSLQFYNFHWTILDNPEKPFKWKLNIIHVKMVHVGCWQANEQTAHCSGNAIYTRNSFIYLSDKWCGKKFHIFPLLGALSVQKRYGLCMSKIYAFFSQRKNTIFTTLSSECDRLL